MPAIRLAVLLLPILIAAPVAVRDAGGAVRAVASIFPVADLVRQVGGEEVEVVPLLPPGATPHTFEPTPGAVRAIAGSRVFFKIGSGLESWADKIVSAAGEEMKVVALSDSLPLIKGLSDSEADRRLYSAALGIDRHTGEEGTNPHVWLDPILAIEMVTKIENALSDLQPRSKDLYASRAESLRKRLEELDREIRQRVSRFSTRRLVTFHNSWAYFARRYGFEETAVIEVAPGRESSPRRLAKIVRKIRSLKVKAVFAEPQLPPRAAETVARETGIPLLTLDPLGGTAPGRMEYIDLMLYNLTVLEKGLR